MAVKSAEELESGLIDFLQNYAQRTRITLRSGPYYTQFSDLIYKLAAKGKVVILIDEYDKPLIDNLSHVEEAKNIRDVLKGFYTVIKAMDAQVRFVFLTGISKFRNENLITFPFAAP